MHFKIISYFCSVEMGRVTQSKHTYRYGSFPTIVPVQHIFYWGKIYKEGCSRMCVILQAVSKRSVWAAQDTPQKALVKNSTFA